MSHCTVPTWNPRHQRQEQTVEAEEANQYPHVHNQQNQINHFMPMSKCEKVAELTWENRQIGMHGVVDILSMSETKPTTLGRAGDTLESIVHQATYHGQNQTSIQNYGQDQNLKIGMCVGKWGESSQHQMAPGATVLAKKRMRSESEPQYFGKLVGEDEYAERSACASASATFCRENDTTMVTWPSFDESSRSIKSKTTCDEDSACHDGGSQENKEEEHETKRSNSSRRSRAAVVHNQSERRRRDRINQKMKALQRLVPNASKTDKASMLDEVINYLKQLQAQVQLMSSVRNMAPQMMMPLGMQQHIQMSLLARMGMGVGLGMGMGMFDMTALARAAAATAAAAAAPHQSLTTHPLIHTNPIATTPTNPFIPSAFAMPAAPAIPSAAQANTVGRATTAVTPATTTTSNSAPFTDPYSAFLTQSMDMEYFNNMAALYRQQANNHSTQTTGSKLNQGNLNIQGQRE